MTAVFNPRSLMPQPYPGESVFSVVARYHRLTGSGPADTLLQELFGSRGGVAPDSLFPSRIAILADAMPATHVFSDVGKIASKHSGLSYFAYFHSEELREGARLALASMDGVRVVRGALGVVGRRMAPRTKHPAFCPQCTADDARERDTTYWRIAHQLPGVAVCPWHGCVLLTGSRDMGVVVPNRFTIRLPPVLTQEQVLAGLPAVEGCGRISPQSLLAVARESAYMLEHPEGCVLPDFRRAIAVAARSHDLVGQGGINPRAFEQHATSVFGRECLEWLGVADQDGVPRWIDNFLHSHYQPRPITCLLLALAFRPSIQRFEQDVMSATERDDAYIDDSWLAPSLRDFRIHLQSGGTMNAWRGRKCHEAIRRWAKRFGHVSTHKCRPLTEVDIRQMVEAACNGASVRDLALRYVQQRDHVWHIVDQFPAAKAALTKTEVDLKTAKYRAKLVKAMATEPSLTRGELRRRNQSSFEWLRVNDAEWLESHVSPAKKRGTHARHLTNEQRDARDCRFAARIEEAGRRLRLKGYPLWIRRETVLREAKVRLAKLWEYKEQYPKTFAMLSTQIESREASVERRLGVALDHFVQVEQQTSWTIVIKRAGIRAAEARQFFERFRDLAAESGFYLHYGANQPLKYKTPDSGRLVKSTKSKKATKVNVDASFSLLL